jgi:hypothetical protein
MTIVIVFWPGLAIALVFHRRVARRPVPLTLVLWIPALAFILLRRVYGFPRMWSYLLLVSLMTACAGLSLALQRLSGRWQTWRLVMASATVLVLAIVVGASLIRQRTLFDSNETGALMDTEGIVSYLAAQLRFGDALLVEGTARPILQYELSRRDPKFLTVSAGPRVAARVVMVLPKRAMDCETCSGSELRAQPSAEAALAAETVQSILARELDVTRYSQPQLWAIFLAANVYSLERKSPR